MGLDKRDLDEIFYEFSRLIDSSISEVKTFFKDFNKITHTIVPALPGYYTLFNDEERKKIDIDSSVIAWDIEKEEIVDINNNLNIFIHPTPITINGRGDDISNYAGILNPDGTIIVPDDRYFKDLEEMQNHIYPKDSVE